MTIDLRKIIQDDSALSHGGFAGAVFLTYTLNLNFYEQIIAPALDQAGCASVLIIADPDGYYGAIEMGAQTVRTAGLRYICAPLARTGRGVQHAKVLLMAGPNRGRLLIGSGNLTLPGYGRNLELYSEFEFAIDKGSAEEQYAFSRVWALLKKVERGGGLARLAREQLANLRESAPWLEQEASTPNAFRVWDNYDTPLWEQIESWRRAQGWGERKIQNLRVISPYFDHAFGALKTITTELNPRSVEIYTGLSSTNLDGAKLKRDWQYRPGKLQVYGVEAKPKTRRRPLHAKAIIGIEREGAWCLAGSANLTEMALTRSWRTGGNLELATFRWLPDHDAFNELLDKEPIRVWVVKLEEVVSVTEEFSENQSHVDAPIHLEELSLRGLRLEGRLSSRIESSKLATLELLRSQARFAITLDSTLTFTVSLTQSLDQAEAARVFIGNFVTPFRWIDQPDALTRYTQRTYHARIRSTLETIHGTEKLFKDLMDFLWERVDPAKITEETANTSSYHRHRHRRRELDSDQEPEIPPPGPEEFITSERLLQFVDQEVNHQHPYDRSTASLRDLLSLALLRLTTPTRASESIDERSEYGDTSVTEEDPQLEQDRNLALERLQEYLYRYCKRYGRRLVDAEFVKQVGPQLLFANHFTLGRVLLEFASRQESFRTDYLRDCFWWVFAPLSWPHIAGLEGRATLLILREEYGARALKKAWIESGMPTLSALLMRGALGVPPRWQDGIWSPQKVTLFMVAREFIGRSNRALGESAVWLQDGKVLNELGLEGSSPEDPSENVVEPSYSQELEHDFARIEDYRSPAEERFAPLIRLDELVLRGEGRTAAAQQFVSDALEQGLGDQLQEYQARFVPIRRMEGDKDFCPRCGVQWNMTHLERVRKGELVLCPNAQDALVYWTPKMPSSVVS